MLTVNKLVPQGKGLAPALLKRATQVELDWDVRSRSRFDATDSSGRRLGVFLPRGQVVRGGDVLVAEDGSLVRVLAAARVPLPRATLLGVHPPDGRLTVQGLEEALLGGYGYSATNDVDVQVPDSTPTLAQLVTNLEGNAFNALRTATKIWS